MLWTMGDSLLGVDSYSLYTPCFLRIGSTKVRAQMKDRSDLFFAASRDWNERVSNEFWNRVFFVFSSLELGIAVRKLSEKN